MHEVLYAIVAWVAGKQRAPGIVEFAVVVTLAEIQRWLVVGTKGCSSSHSDSSYSQAFRPKVFVLVLNIMASMNGRYHLGTPSLLALTRLPLCKFSSQ